jgi:integrase
MITRDHSCVGGKHPRIIRYAYTVPTQNFDLTIRRKIKARIADRIAHSGDHSMEKQILSEKGVANLPEPKKGNKIYYFSGATLQGKKAPAGFGVRVTAGGTKSFVLFHRTGGRKFLETVGRWAANPQGGTLTVRDAIILADRLAKDLKLGRREDARPDRTRRLEDANLPTQGNVAGLLDTFMARYVEGRLRSAKTIRQSLDRLVKPRIGGVGIYELKRSQVSKMLDEIADKHGQVTADRVLAYVRKAFNWYEINGHDDNFKSPVVRGMARTNPSEHARDRVLTDDELRALWAATDKAAGPFGTMLRFILLTACRRSEAAELTYGEVVNGDWTIPAARYKTKRDTTLPLSKAAQDILASIPKAEGTDYVFTIDGKNPIGGYTQLKAKIDKRCGFSDIVIHDLRRTARSLMSRAGVPSDHAERALGHAIGGVRGVYDRHAYLAEKRAAFEALAATVASILDPKSNVVPLRRS